MNNWNGEIYHYPYQSDINFILFSEELVSNYSELMTMTFKIKDTFPYMSNTRLNFNNLIGIARDDYTSISLTSSYFELKNQ